MLEYNGHILIYKRGSRSGDKLVDSLSLYVSCGSVIRVEFDLSQSAAVTRNAQWDIWGLSLISADKFYECGEILKNISAILCEVINIFHLPGSPWRFSDDISGLLSESSVRSGPPYINHITYNI